MWWPSRRLGALVALAMAWAGLAGCGFEPLYGPAQEERLAGIAIERIPERDGQILRNALLERLSPAGPSRWRLAVELTASRSSLVGGEGDTQRVRLTFTGAYRLIPAGPDRGKRKTEAGEARVTTSFNEPDPILATEAAERAAKRQALAELADRLVDAAARHLQDSARRQEAGT